MTDTALIAERHEPETQAQAFGRERERIHRQMLSSVSHDLKTPLASIIGSLEIFTRMKEALAPEKQATLIKVALQEAYRLDSFITNILDMAKLENGLVKPKQEEVEIGAMLRDCLTRAQHYLQDCAIEIEPSETLKAVADSVLLTRVVCLALDNAAKYGGRPSTIQLRYGKSGNQLGYISIQDNGNGIPENQAEAIFSKYTRFGNEDQKNAGTGLGLAIAREIMRLLGGGITAANSPGGGALFTIHLPLR